MQWELLANSFRTFADSICDENVASATARHVCMPFKWQGRVLRGS